MKALILRLEKVIPRFVIYAVSWFAFLTHTLSAPETALPNFNTADGDHALSSINTGVGNSAFGAFALFANSTGSYNTAVGVGALDLNNGESNTAVGAAALLFNSSGHGNTATGVDALYSNTIGVRNTATGAFALFMNTMGNENTAVGNQALGQNPNGTGNIAIGHQAGFSLALGSNNIDIGNVGVNNESNTIRIGDPAIHGAVFLAGITKMSPAAPNQAVLVEPGTGLLGSADVSSFGVLITDPENTAVGDQALASNSGASNTATGFRALFSNTDGYRNTAVGASALMSNTGDVTGLGAFNCAVGVYALANNDGGFSNNAFGDSALFANIAGAGNTAVGDLALADNGGNGSANANFNTAVGAQALLSNLDGNSNNAFGASALAANFSGLYNQAIGAFALMNNTTGNSNIAIGDTAGDNVTTADNVICIGDLVAGENVSNSCYIGNISGASGGAQAVYVNGNGKLGFQVSSRRFKDEIKPMQNASELIYRLKPVSFRYKPEIEATRPHGFGLIAEDVEKISPDLVTRDTNGKVGSVRYDAVNAMLLNEFLKEHKKVQELEANDAEQQREIKALVATVKEQAAQIQKVSAQLELSKGLVQTAAQ